MDSFIPLELLSVDDIFISCQNYKVWADGKCISRGITPLTFSAKKVRVEGAGAYQCTLDSEELNKFIDVYFDFDALISLHDRLLLCLSPKSCNVQDITFEILKVVLGQTRDTLLASSTRPICMSFFFEDGNVSKVSIKLLKPERLIELW